jgi:hypothetical protein
MELCGAILERMRNLLFTALLLPSFCLPCPRLGSAQSTAPAMPPAEISADLGPCSASITVADQDSKPIYGAKIDTRIQYGLLGVKRLDLEAYTGVDGRVKIARLPETLKKPMYIRIEKNGKQAIVEFKPSLQCNATFDVLLR